MAARVRDRLGRGFTLIELLVVLAALGILLSLAAPRYIEHVDRAREAVLKQNLAAMRDAIDKFHADRARYPASLAELVQERYLRTLPLDPITDREDTWQVLARPRAGVEQGGASRSEVTSNSVDTTSASKGVVFDVRSGALGMARDGSRYAAW